MRITLAHQTAIAFAMLFAALFLPTLASNAHADIRGPCSASVQNLTEQPYTGLTDVNTIDSPGTAYQAHSDDQLVVSMFTSNEEDAPTFEYHRFQLEFAGFRWTIAEDFENDRHAWDEAFTVSDYAKYGKGLYKVIGYSRLTDDSECIGIAYFDVQGNRLSSVAGAAAAAATAVATVAVVGAGAAAAGGKDPLNPDKIGDQLESMAGGQDELDKELQKERQHAKEVEAIRLELHSWEKGFGPDLCLFLVLPALVLTGMTMATGGGQAAPAPMPPRRRMAWRPRLSAIGMLGGLIGGAAVVVLLQQFSVLYPTLAVAIIGLVGGLAVGILIPSLGRVFRVRRVNRKLARLEARLKELETQPGTRGAQS